MVCPMCCRWSTSIDGVNLVGSVTPVFIYLQHVDEGARYLNYRAIHLQVVGGGDLFQISVNVYGCYFGCLYVKLCRLRLGQGVCLFGVVFRLRTAVEGGVLAEPLPVGVINVARRVGRVLFAGFRRWVGFMDEGVRRGEIPNVVGLLVYW